MTPDQLALAITTLHTHLETHKDTPTKAIENFKRPHNPYFSVHSGTRIITPPH